MTTITTILALLAVTALVGWTIGGLLLRMLGGLTVISGLLLASIGHPAGVAAAALGAGVWLAGQYVYGLRHHAYRSPLARRLYARTPLARLDATRGWVIPTTAASPAHCRRRTRHGHRRLPHT